MNNLHLQGLVEQKSYTLSDYYPESSAYVQMNMSGVNNHKTDFDLYDNIVEIDGRFPTNLPLEFKVFTREPSQGTKLLVKSTQYITDGVTRRFELPEEISNIAECIFSLEGARQIGNVANLIDNKYIEFTEVPESGLVLELNSISYKMVEGYSTDISLSQVKIDDATNIIELPLSPENKDHVFPTINGLHVTKSSFALADNKLVFKDVIPSGSKVETLVFHNILSEGLESDDLPGMFIDAISTSKGVSFIRHNKPPIKIPAPEFEIEGAEGIKVEGQYPNFVIKSTIASQIAQDEFKSFNQQNRTENSGTVSVTQRVKFNGDVIISASADFNATLGKGYNVNSGNERIQVVLGFKTSGQNEPDFERDVEGTAETGIHSNGRNDENTYGYADKSLNRVISVRRANNPQGYVEVVAKMRLADTATTYNSVLTAALNITVMPKLG